MLETRSTRLKLDRRSGDPPRLGRRRPSSTRALAELPDVKGKAAEPAPPARRLPASPGEFLTPCEQKGFSHTVEP